MKCLLYASLFLGLNGPLQAKATFNSPSTQESTYSHQSNANKADQLIVEKPTDSLSKKIEALEEEGYKEENKGDINKALTIYKKVIFLQNQKHGLNNPFSALTMTKIGGLYKQLHEYSEAKEYYKKALSINSNIFGETSRFNIGSLVGIAIIYDEINDFKNAEEYYKKALRIAELPDTEISTLINILSIVGTYYSGKNEYSVAKEYYERILDLSKNNYGDNSLQHGRALSRLAGIYNREVDLVKSEEFYLKSLSIYKSILGEVHIEISDLYNNLAGVYRNQNKINEAERYYLKSLDIKEQLYGKDNIKLADNLNYLGGFYLHANKPQLAKKQHKRALSIIQSIRNKPTKQEAITYSYLGWAHQQLGEYKEAENCYEQQYSIIKTIFGENHPEMNFALQNIAALNLKLSKYNSSIKTFIKVINILENYHGEESIKLVLPLKRLASAYEQKAEYKEAEILYKRALSIQENFLGSSHPDIANTLVSISYFYKYYGKYNLSEDYLLRALEIRKKTFGTKHILVNELFQDYAFILLKKSKFKEAKDQCNRALNINRDLFGENSLQVAANLSCLARIYSDQGKYNEAINFLKLSLEIKEKILGPNNPDIASSLSGLAMEYESIADYRMAAELYKRKLNIYENNFGKNHPELASALTPIGYMYFNSSDYRESEDYFLRALSILENKLGKNHPKLRNTLGGLITLYEKLENYDQSIKYLFRLYEIKEAIHGINHPDTALVLERMGKLSLDFNAKAAQQFFETVQLIYNDFYEPNHQNIATNLYWLGNSYFEQNDYPKAKEYLLKSLNISENNLGENHPDLTSNLKLLAQININQGELINSFNLFYRALSIEEKAYGKSHPYVANTLLRIADLLISQKEYQKAEKTYLRALRIREEILGKYHPLVSQAQIDFASFQNALGQNKNSEMYMKNGIKTEIELIQREAPFMAQGDRIAFVSSLGDSYFKVFTSSLKNESAKETALFARLNRHGLLQQIEKYQSNIANSSGTAKTISSEIKSLSQKLSSVNLSKEERKSLLDSKNELEKKLYRILPQIKTKFVSTNEISEKLPEDSLLIEFQKFIPFMPLEPSGQKWQEAKYLALILKPDNKIDIVDLGLAEPIDQKIKKALSASEKAQPNAQILWNEVSSLIIFPLKNKISDSKTLFISPDSEVNNIPFAVLSSDKDKSLLGEKFNLRLLTTGRELLELEKNKTVSNRQPIVIANPTFDATNKVINSEVTAFYPQQRSRGLDSRNWQPLPGTEREGKSISKLINAKYLSKEKATALSVQKQESPKVLHIASHAFFQENTDKVINPLLRSGIVMAGANHPDTNNEDDGYLTALEVAKIDWEGTEMVVISGCESGKGEIQSGEGIYGLKRAISVAGARSSLLSLWKVDDAATAAFMNSFYEKLKAGLGRSDALAATQKEFKSHPIPKWRHPYVWAAFQLNGDWKSIKW